MASRAQQWLPTTTTLSGAYRKVPWVELGLGLGGVVIGIAGSNLVRWYRRRSLAFEGGSESGSSEAEEIPGFFVGVDLGGTAIKVVLVDHTGDAIQELTEDVHSRAKGPVLNQITRLVERVCTGPAANAVGCSSILDVECVGVGLPGNVDVAAGVLVSIANFDWRNEPLARNLSEILDVPVVLENDAKAAALGEMWRGAGEGASNLVLITVGTGIGSAIVSQGQLLRGHTNMAGEIGHSIYIPEGRLSAPTGVKGIFEEYGSATAVIRSAQAALTDPENTTSTLHHTSPLTCKAIFEAANHGDALATELVGEMTEALGILCINVCRFVDPSVIVLAGGPTQAGDAFFDRVRAAYSRHRWNILPNTCDIVPSQLGAKVGSIGAAAAAKIYTRGGLGGY
eukprot:c2390_g1_i1.p1 GENE.c2390_g1_i1~~c2390_g1_i1.p1  ORF type:complete len:397 (+),score=78.48 c2390_g1_i1:56-1246(+)